MTSGFWFWKNRLVEVMQSIATKANVEVTSSMLDEIKYGLVGSSDEKNYWFEYKIGNATIRLASDDADNDIVLIQLTGVDGKSIEELSVIETP